MSMESSPGKKPRKKFKLSWHFYVICALIVTAAVALFYHFSRVEEYAYELADLEVMRNAEDTAKLLWFEKAPNEPVEYWYVPGELRLIPITDPMPPHCGMGTKKAGGAVRAFEAKTGNSYGYSESEDYRNKALHVTVNNINGSLSITVDWVICS